MDLFIGLSTEAVAHLLDCDGGALVLQASQTLRSRVGCDGYKFYLTFYMATAIQPDARVWDESGVQ